MPKRKLQIIKHDAEGALLGAGVRCNKTFNSSRALTGPARQLDIAKRFEAHPCNPLDSSQNALRIVREAPEDK
jgi:hypothetical protein